MIDTKKTWEYLTEISKLEQLAGAPNDVSTENISFDEVMKKILF